MVDSFNPDIFPEDKDKLTNSNIYGSRISIEDLYSGAGNGSSKEFFKVIEDRISLSSCKSDGLKVCNSEHVDDVSELDVDKDN